MAKKNTNSSSQKPSGITSAGKVTRMQNGKITPCSTPRPTTPPTKSNKSE